MFFKNSFQFFKHFKLVKMCCFITIFLQHKKNNQTGDNGKNNLLWGQGAKVSWLLSSSLKKRRIRAL